MEINSKSTEMLLKAIKKGYKVTERGKLINPKGNVLMGSFDSSGYPCISLVRKGTVFKLRAQSIVAYNKFGNEMFKKEKVISHKNGNINDLHYDNIILIDRTQVLNSRFKEDRKQFGLNAASQKRKLTAEEIIHLRKQRYDGRSLTYLAELYGLSKGNVSDICNYKIYREIKFLTGLEPTYPDPPPILKPIKSKRSVPPSEVKSIRKLRREGMQVKLLMKKYKRTKATIRKICNYETYIEMEYLTEKDLEIMEENGIKPI